MQISVNIAQEDSAITRIASSSKPQKDSPLILALATSQALRALVGLRLAELRLASGQDRLLMVLAERDKLSASALADELNVRPSTVSKMLDRLTARGYTQRLADADDARRILLQLTPDGRAICGRLRGLWNDIDTGLSADLPPTAVEQILTGLRLLNDQVGRRLRRLR